MADRRMWKAVCRKGTRRKVYRFNSRTEAFEWLSRQPIGKYDGIAMVPDFEWGA